MTVSARDLVPVRSFAEWAGVRPASARVRNAVRDAAVLALSLGRSPPRGSWLRFPYWHTVFDDERAGFAAQLRWLRAHGEFISLDDAVALLRDGRPIDGRYFCLTFDDGFASCGRNALPLLLDAGAPATIFLPTRFMGATPATHADLLRGFDPQGRYVEFLTWDDCRALAGQGITFGSHTAGHRKLAELSDAEAEAELRESKGTIERELGRPCLHFCAPYGWPGVHFRPDRDPALAGRVGYRSFHTGVRGSARRRPDPMLLERDGLLASWPAAQLRWFFSR